jgi:hypothetical protein
MFRSSDSAVVSDSALVLVGAQWAGFRLDRVIVSIPGMALTAGATALPVLERTTAAALLRCTAAHGFLT